ncbi:MAG: hypothetical protein IIY71_04125, partial [Oscillospiraceae bacterium]|nr:hypothetical protein [Oscillospiraceae bacterium]
NPVWNCQWTCFVSSCMLVYPNYTKSVLQNFTFWKIFLYNFFHYSSSVGRNMYFCDIHQKRKEPLPSNSSIMIPVSSNIITPLSKKFINQIKKNVRIPWFLVTAVFFASLGADTKVAKNILPERLTAPSAARWEGEWRGCAPPPPWLRCFASQPLR